MQRIVIDPGRRWGKRAAYERGLAVFRALGYRIEEVRGPRGAVCSIITRQKERT